MLTRLFVFKVFGLRRALDGGLGLPSVNQARSNQVLVTATALRATVLSIKEFMTVYEEYMIM